MISPQSAGKVSLEEDEPPQDTPLDQAKMENSDDGPIQTVTIPTENLTAKIESESNPPDPASLSTQEPATESPAPVAKEAIQSFFQSVNLHIRFTKRTRISVAQDDGQPEKFIFAKGEESTWQASSHITLHVDEADAVELTLNGTPVTVDDSDDGPLAITLPTDLGS